MLRRGPDANAAACRGQAISGVAACCGVPCRFLFSMLMLLLRVCKAHDAAALAADATLAVIHGLVVPAAVEPAPAIVVVRQDDAFRGWQSAKDRGLDLMRSQLADASSPSLIGDAGHMSMVRAHGSGAVTFVSWVRTMAL